MYSVSVSMHANLTLVYLIVRYICTVQSVSMHANLTLVYLIVRYIYSVECQYARKLDFNISYSQVHMYSVVSV